MNTDTTLQKLPNGTRIHLWDGRTGTITGEDDFSGKYEVLPDDASEEEVARQLRYLVAPAEAKIVKEAV